MSKAIPSISKYMTVVPKTISIDESMAQAEALMKEHHIRHLPVMQGHDLVGVISERDVQLIKSFQDANPKEIKVRSAYKANPYKTKPEAGLDQVCDEMASHKFGCALIVDNNKLVGIFTWIDALRAMSQLMETRLKH